MSRWNLYDPDFYDEIVPFGGEVDDEDEEEEEVLLTCTCYGRGKKLSEVDVPRVPQLQYQIEKQKYFEKMRSSEDQNSRKVGRGRARIRQKTNNSEKITSVGQSQISVPEIPFASNHSSSSDISQQIKSGGFGRPTFPMEQVDNYDVTQYNPNIQPARRGFSIEDFISGIGSKKIKKKRNNKTSTGSTPVLSSTDETDRCISPENNEAVAMLEDSAPEIENEADHEIDGYLLSRMLNIPCPTGNKIINTVGKACSLTASSKSAMDMLDAFDNFEDAITAEKKKSKKKVSSKKSSVDNKEEGGWELSGENVIEVSDLPGDCDIMLLRDLIAAYGTIIESDVISTGSTVSIRYKLDSYEAADWVVSNLHGADYLFPDYCVKCRKVI